MQSIYVPNYVLKNKSNKLEKANATSFFIMT